MAVDGEVTIAGSMYENKYASHASFKKFELTKLFGFFFKMCVAPHPM